MLYGYEATLNDISAAAQSAVIHKKLFENQPPFKLEVLAARALRAKLIDDSWDVLTKVNNMLKKNQITIYASEAL